MDPLNYTKYTPQEREAIQIVTRLCAEGKPIILRKNDTDLCAVAIIPYDPYEESPPMEQFKVLVREVIDRVGGLITAKEVCSEIPLDIWKKYSRIREYEALLYPGEVLLRTFNKRKVEYAVVKKRRE